MNNFKEFFKPTIANIILFLILIGGLNYLIISNTFIDDATILVGIPLGFYPVGSTYVQYGKPMPTIPNFSVINFIIDIIFWYVISAVIINLYFFAGKDIRKYVKRKT